MKWTLLPLLLLASCGPTPEPPPSRTFEPSYERAQVGPTAAAVDRVTQDTRREADALRNQVGILRKVASDATSAAKSASAEIDRLVAQKSATEGELLNLSRMFKDLEQRNLFLETEADRTGVDVQQLNETITKLETTVREMRVSATKKDEEVAELRQLLKSANDHNDELASTNERLAQAAAKAEVKEASAKTYRNIVISLVVAFLLYLLTPVLIKAFKPL